VTAERARILVVDDKENMRNLLRDILSAQHDVALAGDAAAARDQLEAARFEVVLTDVRMPGQDGFELVRFVKDRWPLTEVIMMTAFASIPSAVEAMRRGAYDYLQKPFDPDDVSLVVTRALQRHRDCASAQKPEAHPGTSPETELASLSYREALASARDKGSREYLVALLRAFGGNVSRAAERAGLERESLHRLLRRHGIHASVFRESDRGEDT
jgi:DNA-binding NtrC family response regulator